MMVFDMTAQLAPIFHGMVALLAISSAAIFASALDRDVANRWLHFKRRNKPGISRRGTIVPASA